MVRAFWVFSYDFCWRLYSIFTRTVERFNLSFLVYHDRRFSCFVHFLETLQRDEMRSPNEVDLLMDVDVIEEYTRNYVPQPRM